MDASTTIPDKFITISNPRKHSAWHTYANGGEEFVSAQPTEIDLVAKLNEMGINLRDYRTFASGGVNWKSIVGWVRR